jgi:hypothetical protein
MFLKGKLRAFSPCHCDASHPGVGQECETSPPSSAAVSSKGSTLPAAELVSRGRRRLAETRATLPPEVKIPPTLCSTTPWRRPPEATLHPISLACFPPVFFVPFFLSHTLLLSHRTLYCIHRVRACTEASFVLLLLAQAASTPRLSTSALTWSAKWRQTFPRTTAATRLCFSNYNV